MLRISFDIVKMLSLLPSEKINSRRKYYIVLNSDESRMFAIHTEFSSKENDFNGFYKADEIYRIGKNGELDFLDASEYESVEKTSDILIGVNNDMLYFLCEIKEEISHYEKFGNGIHLYLNDMGKTIYAEIIWPNGKGNDNGRKPKGYRFDVSSRRIDKYVFL